MKPIDPTSVYRGRFAPSPTGPLHFGSLVTALGSFLQARHHGGEWHLRIDDLDPYRYSAEAATLIPKQLEAFGLQWDGVIEYQSSHEPHYHRLLQHLIDHHHAYPCGCTRREVAASPRVGPEGPVYPGTCRNGVARGKRPHAIRMKVVDSPISINDPVQGQITSQLSQDVGDFIVQRTDGVIAYQLAAAINDVEGGFTEVVRGADLLSSTLRQVWLHQCLGLPSPHYLHLPVATFSNGKKLSKQTHAEPLTQLEPSRQLIEALTFLNQAPPEGLHDGSAAAILDWAVEHWEPSRFARVLKKPRSTIPTDKHRSHSDTQL